MVKFTTPNPKKVKIGSHGGSCSNSGRRSIDKTDRMRGFKKRGKGKSKLLNTKTYCTQDRKKQMVKTKDDRIKNELREELQKKNDECNILKEEL